MEQRTAPATVLVVDDEPSLRETIAYTLRREGFVVETAAEGTRALAIARERSPDLIVLDIMLPGMDGLQVCRALRRESTVPIVMLSARGEELDRVLGLEIGADDYVTKPFAMRELVARIRAQLRRVEMGMSRPDAVPVDAETVEIGDLWINPGERRVQIRSEELGLKPKEFDLLLYFATHPDKVLSRAQLLRDVWGYDVPIDTRTIDVHVRWLRQKLERVTGAVPQIETVWGIGYRLAPPRPAMS
jgi:two-component system, OmpR family, alkaline phosphatase synthesis response regulator PhoP